MDMAIVRGTVGSEIDTIKGDGSERCQFTLDTLLSEEKVVNGKPVTYAIMTSILATGNPDLTQRIQNLLERNDDVLLYGVIGFHNGKLKMRVSDISLPPTVLSS